MQALQWINNKMLAIKHTLRPYLAWYIAAIVTLELILIIGFHQ